MQAGREEGREGGVTNTNDADSTFDCFIFNNKIICCV